MAIKQRKILSSRFLLAYGIILMSIQSKKTVVLVEPEGQPASHPPTAEEAPKQ